MVFGSRHFLSSFNLLNVRSDSGEIIPISRSINFLGVELDRQLNFNTQISYMCSSINATLKNVRLIRKLMDKSSAETLVHAFVTNKLDYCNLLFAGLSSGNLAKLQLMQNNAVRTVLKLSSHSSVSEHLKDLHWLPVRARIYFRYLVLIFKCLNNMAPEQLAEKLQISSAINMTLSTSKFYPSTEFGKQACSYMALKCRNGLPREIRVLTDINTFKSSVKTYFFDNFID